MPRATILGSICRHHPVKLFQKLRDRFKGKDASGILRGTISLTMGAGFAKLIGIASIAVLARIYSPDDYAVLAIYSALVNIIVPVMTLRYVIAVPLPKTDAAAANVMALSALLVVAISMLGGAAMWLLGPGLLGALEMDALTPWRGLVIAGAVAVAVYEGLTMWATRKHAFSIIARTQVVQSLMGEGLKIALGLAGLRPFGLMLGQLVSQSGGISSLALTQRKEYRRLARFVSVTRMKRLAKRYWSFPAYRLPSQVLLIGSAQMPVLLSATFYGKDATGQLALAFTALAVPATLMADSVGKAYFAGISKLGRRKPREIRALTFSVIRTVLLLALAPTIALMFAGEWIFTHAFGSKWALAGHFASFLSILMIAQFVNRATVSYLMSVFDGQREVLFLNIQRVLLTFGCFWIGDQLGATIDQALLAYALLLSAHYTVGVWLALRKLRPGANE